MLPDMAMRMNWRSVMALEEGEEDEGEGGGGEVARGGKRASWLVVSVTTWEDVLTGIGLMRESWEAGSLDGMVEGKGEIKI